MRRVPTGASSLSSAISLPFSSNSSSGFWARIHCLENVQLLGIFLDVGQRNLVGAPKALKPVTTHFFRRAPSLRGTQHDHRPAGPATPRRCFCIPVDALGSPGCNARRSPPSPDACCRDLSPPRNRVSSHILASDLPTPRADACQKRRIIDLVSVQVKDWQNRAIANGIQKLADVPGSC